MKRGRILIAEDEKKIRSLLTLYLEQNDYEVIEARDGREALDLVLKYVPDLVVLDILMPIMNGIEVCEQIRSHHRLREIPVIYLSSLNEKQSIISGLEKGGDDYVTKPFDPNVLIARINVLLRRTKGNSPGNHDYKVYEELTFQERKILEWIEKGFTNREIATTLKLTEGTVKVYNHTIYQKLQVKNRTQAIVRAKELKIL